MMQDRKWELEIGQRWESAAAGMAAAPARTDAVVETAPADTSEKDLPWKTRARPVMSLLLQFANGLTRSMRYFDIVAQDNRGGEIVLYCERCTITIKGRHQERLFPLLAEERVWVIEERHRTDWRDESGKPYIESITIDKPRLEALESGPQRRDLA